MLVDELLKHLLQGGRFQQQLIEVSSHPFQDGYYDFIKYDTLADAVRTNGPPRTSMFDDLCYYSEEHTHVLELGDDPRCVTVFPEMIMASQYMLLIQYYRNHLSHLEWVLSRRDHFAALDIQRVEDGGAICSRCTADWVTHIMMRLTLTWAIARSAKWLDSQPDFAHVLSRLDRLEHQAETLLASFTGLVGIVGNRQSLFEARTVRLFTVLGMTFLPLSLTSGIFSMAFPYAPGNDRFWIYFAVSIPLVLLVFAVPFAFNYWHDKRMSVEMNRGKYAFSR